MPTVMGIDPGWHNLWCATVFGLTQPNTRQEARQIFNVLKKTYYRGISNWALKKWEARMKRKDCKFNEALLEMAQYTMKDVDNRADFRIRYETHREAHDVLSGHYSSRSFAKQHFFGNQRTR